jgi:hypothetical protein
MNRIIIYIVFKIVNITTEYDSSTIPTVHKYSNVARDLNSFLLLNFNFQCLNTKLQQAICATKERALNLSIHEDTFILTYEPRG